MTQHGHPKPAVRELKRTPGSLPNPLINDTITLGNLTTGLLVKDI